MEHSTSTARPRSRRPGDGGYRCDLSPLWSVHRGPNGGYLAAVALRALTEAVGDPGAGAALAHDPLRAPAGGARAARRRDAGSSAPAGRSRASRPAWCRATSSSGSRSPRSRCRARARSSATSSPPDDVPPPEECTPRRLPVDPSIPMPAIARRWETRWAVGRAARHAGRHRARRRLDPAPRGSHGRRARGRGDDRRVDPAGLQPGRGADGRARPSTSRSTSGPPAAPRRARPTTGCSRRSAPTPRPTGSSRRTARSGAGRRAARPVAPARRRPPPRLSTRPRGSAGGRWLFSRSRISSSTSSSVAPGSFGGKTFS